MKPHVNLEGTRVVHRDGRRGTLKRLYGRWSHRTGRTTWRASVNWDIPPSNYRSNMVELTSLKELTDETTSTS